MKKFRFTLARMLEFKTQILDREKDLLGSIRQKKNEIDSKIERFEQAIKELSSELLQEQTKGISVKQLQFYSMQIENARCCLVQLYIEQQAMERELERQQSVVVKASQEVRSLEKLRDKQLGMFRYEEKRAGEAEMLEFVTGKIVRKSRFIA